jgi:transcriptional regulator with XRE-family HTH domain
MSADAMPAVDLKRSVAEEIRALLGRRDISKIELARRIEKSHTYVWRRLSGETAFDLDDLQKIAAVLGVTAADLLPREVTRQYLPGQRVLATIGAPSPKRPTPPRPRSHKPGRPVAQTRPIGRTSLARPSTPVPA